MAGTRPAGPERNRNADPAIGRGEPLQTVAGFEVNVVDLKREPGLQRHVTRSATDLDGVRLDSVDVAATAVEIELLLEVVGSQLTAVGSIDAAWTGPCRRCLEPLSRTVTVAEVQEIFEARPVEGETYPLGDEIVDLGVMVREAVMLALPSSPLCSEDCRGPAPDTFPAGSEETAIDLSPLSDDDTGDPRWAALDQLVFDSEDP